MAAQELEPDVAFVERERDEFASASPRRWSRYYPTLRREVRRRRRRAPDGGGGLPRGGGRGAAALTP